MESAPHPFMRSVSAPSAPPPNEPPTPDAEEVAEAAEQVNISQADRIYQFTKKTLNFHFSSKT